MEQWEKNYYITAVAGSDVGRSLVVMSKGKWKFIFQMVYNYFSSVLLISQPYILNSLFFFCLLTSLTLNIGTQYLQQSYKVSDSFPFKWIKKKWREGFYVTDMATSGSRWAVVMSRGAGFSDQVCLGALMFLFLGSISLYFRDANI